MTENEKQLIDMIRNHPEPDKALEAAVAVIITFLKREGIIVYDSVDDSVYKA